MSTITAPDVTPKTPLLGKLSPYTKAAWAAVAPFVTILAGEYIKDGGKMTWGDALMALAVAVASGTGVFGLANRTKEGLAITKPEDHVDPALVAPASDGAVPAEFQEAPQTPLTPLTEPFSPSQD